MALAQEISDNRSPVGRRSFAKWGRIYMESQETEPEGFNVAAVEAWIADNVDGSVNIQIRFECLENSRVAIGIRTKSRHPVSVRISD